jgi:hypothetical protein
MLLKFVDEFERASLVCTIERVLASPREGSEVVAPHRVSESRLAAVSSLSTEVAL